MHPNGGNNLLSIVPYRVLPATGGGHAAILQLHDYLGKICQNHIASTTDNADAGKYSFLLHKVFPAKAERYVPYYKFKALKSLAKGYDISYIICEHPYMAITAVALAKALKVPWFLRSHNIESERFRSLGKKWWPVLRMYEQWAMQMANGIFFITPEDATWAIEHFRQPREKCHIIPFGTPLQEAPNGHDEAKEQLAKQYNVPADVPWLYFLGAMDYQPNILALKNILDSVLPALDANGVKYQFFVAGKGMPSHLIERLNTQPNAQYTGFVEDLDVFLKACDIMLNTVTVGGGIKTKAVEALAYNKLVVSTKSGAAGLQPEVCGNNLIVGETDDMGEFVEKTITALQQKPDIPHAFYGYYHSGNIAKKALSIMQRTAKGS